MAGHRKGLNFRKQKKKINIPLIREIIIWLGEMALTVALAAVVVYFVGVRTSVVGQSMAPQLLDGEQVLVDRFIYKVTKPKIGDVIVFLPNGNEKSHYYVKRVVAAAGDTIRIEDGVIYVNGKQEMNSHLNGTIADPGVAAEEIQLGVDECFVLGDHPAGSEDSRYANIGNVKSEYIVGKAWFKLLPFSDAGFID